MDVSYSIPTAAINIHLAPWQTLNWTSWQYHIFIVCLVLFPDWKLAVSESTRRIKVGSGNEWEGTWVVQELLSIHSSKVKVKKRWCINFFLHSHSYPLFIPHLQKLLASSLIISWQDCYSTSDILFTLCFDALYFYHTKWLNKLYMFGMYQNEFENVVESMANHWWQ